MIQRSRSSRPSSLQTKGFLTLSLLIFGESVTFSNAISFWNNLHHAEAKAPDEDLRRMTSTQLAAECPTNGTPPSPSLASFVGSKKKHLITSLHKRPVLSSTRAASFDSKCCHDCADCLDAVTRAKHCFETIPRGGHQQHVHDTTAAVASTTPAGIPLQGWKVIFQAILTAINVLCWLLPLKSKKISENKLALSLANAFSAGVFLSLAFGHLIPECVHMFADASKLPAETPYLLVLAGYLIIFFIEKVAFDAHEILHEMQDSSSHHHHHGDHDHKQVSTTTQTNGSNDKAASSSSGRSAVILLGALAVHSVLEMMALGLADSFADCALLTLSISLHQPAESIALLVAFLKSGMSNGQIIQYLSIFSCMGPIGVALGMAVNEFAAPIVDACMLAIVAGTFVYVGATEVIPEEWEDGSHKWPKFAALITGIVSILVITQYTMSLGGHVH